MHAYTTQRDKHTSDAGSESNTNAVKVIKKSNSRGRLKEKCDVKVCGAGQVEEVEGWSCCCDGAVAAAAAANCVKKPGLVH